MKLFQRRKKNILFVIWIFMKSNVWPLYQCTLFRVLLLEKIILFPSKFEWMYVTQHQHQHQRGSCELNRFYQYMYVVTMVTCIEFYKLFGSASIVAHIYFSKWIEAEKHFTLMLFQFSISTLKCTVRLRLFNKFILRSNILYERRECQPLSNSIYRFIN